MIKHNFKIGDKVKLKDPNQWSIGFSTGVVVGFNKGYIHVTWEGDMCWRNYPHLLREIEHIVKVGEQLMFTFMMDESQKGN